MNACVSEGTIQGFMDGELATPELRRVVSHLACCDSCAKAERAARREADVLSSLFAPDGFAAVPSERLWAGIVTSLGETRRLAWRES